MEQKHLVYAGLLASCAFINHSAFAAQAATTGTTISNQPQATAIDVSQYPGLTMPLGGKRRVQINGFLSAGVSKTNSSIAYLIPGHGSVQNTWNYAVNSLAGLQFSAFLNNKLSAVVQVVADGDNENGNSRYQPTVDWAFVRYAPNSHVQLRAGRFRLPLFVYSNTEQVGYSYPQVFLPNEVYRLVPFDNMNGFDAIGTVALGGSGWSASAQPFLGTNKSKYDLYQVTPSAPLDHITVSFDEDSLYGIKGEIGNQYFTFEGTYAHLKLTATAPSTSDPIGTSTIFSNKPTTFYSLGTKLDYKKLLFTAEYAKRKTPDQIAALEGYYAMIGAHLGKWLPNFTYGHIKTTNTAKLASERANGVQAEYPEAQRSYTFGLDYYFNAHIDAKIAYSKIHPLDGTKGLFVISPSKSNVNLYSLSIDAIF